MDFFQQIHFSPVGKLEDRKGCVICLPGRGSSGPYLAGQYQERTRFKDTLFVGLTPPDAAWYPMPNGPDDQEDALRGLEEARQAVTSIIKLVIIGYHVPLHQIALVGFSAGAAVALDVMAHTSTPLAGVVSHSGCCLDPKNLPEARCRQKVCLFHRKDDQVFSYEKRYLPTKAVLEEKGYEVRAVEQDEGGHTILPWEYPSAAVYLGQQLGYGIDWLMEPYERV